jgi:hypothetical protein
MMNAFSFSFFQLFFVFGGSLVWSRLKQQKYLGFMIPPLWPVYSSSPGGTRTLSFLSFLSFFDWENG